MGGGIFGIGTSGLLSSQQQIATTGHNISNVNTAGYARQRTELSTTLPNFSGAGYVGTGVKIDTTRRYYDEFLEDQIRSSNSQLGKFERFNELASQIDNILANPDAGLTPTLEAFYNALQEANDFPSSVPARSVLLTSANTLVDRFGLLQERFIDLNSQTNSNLEDVAAEITARAASIAELNTQISIQTGAGNGNLPNDSLDKRENLIKEISQLVDVDVIYQDNGAANVFIGSGQALVLNSTAFSMSIRDSEFTPQDKTIFLSNNNTSVEVTDHIKGGEIQGLLDFKNQVLEPSFNALGRIAASVTMEMNQQHSLGMTLQQDAAGNYQNGGNFFTDITNDYTGPSFQITDQSNFITSNYQVDLTGAGVYTLTRFDNETGALSAPLATGADLAAFNTDLVANGLGMYFDSGMTTGTYNIEANGQSILPSNTNTGTADYTLQVTDTSTLTTSDYELSYDGANYELKRLSDGLSIIGASVDAINTELLNPNSNFGSSQGFQLSLNLATGPILSGDKFLIQPTHDLSRSMAVNINDVLDIALASPIVAKKPTDALGVGTNTGTGEITFVPPQTPTGALTNIPLTDVGGNFVEVVLTFDSANNEFNVTTTPAAAVPAVPAGPIAYNPTTQSGTTLSCSSLNRDLSI